jgi:hypothetical protein
VVIQPRQFQVRSAQVHFTGNDGEMFERGALDFVQQAPFAQQDAIRAGPFDFFQAQPAGGVGLWIQIEEEHAFAQSREAGGKIDGGGRFPHAAFLVGDGDDFGWHRPDLMKTGMAIQVNKRENFLRGTQKSQLVSEN